MNPRIFYVLLGLSILFVAGFTVSVILLVYKNKPLPPLPPLPKTGGVRVAYYTPYQDPYCSPQTSCPPSGTPCATTILSDPKVLNSKLDIVILNPIAPSTVHGLTVAFPVSTLLNKGTSLPSGLYTCPPALAKGIADLHRAGKRILLSVLPGTGSDQWGTSAAFWSLFAQASQKLLTEWDIDGFDWDCETSQCPPQAFDPSGMGTWSTQATSLCVKVFQVWKGLKVNPGRGNGGQPITTLTGEIEWQLKSLPSFKPFMSDVDFLCTMNNDYTLVSASDLANVIKDAEAKGWTRDKLVLGVAPSECSGGAQNPDTFQRAIAGLAAMGYNNMGWALWNLCKDAGCYHGRQGGKTCGPCATGSCPIGDGTLTQASTSFAFLSIMDQL